MAYVRKLQIKRGPAVTIPILDNGELAFTTDTKKLYIGDSTGNMLLSAHLNKEKLVRSNKDSNGIFLTVEKFRDDNTLDSRSVMSDGTAPQYTTRTETFYANDGITVIATNVYTVAYDVDGDFISETPVV